MLVSEMGLKDVHLEGVGNGGLGTCWVLLGGGWNSKGPSGLGH